MYVTHRRDSDPNVWAASSTPMTAGGQQASHLVNLGKVRAISAGHCDPHDVGDLHKPDLALTPSPDKGRPPTRRCHYREHRKEQNGG